MISLISFITILLLVIFSVGWGIFTLINLDGREGLIIGIVFLLGWIFIFSTSIRFDSILLENISLMFLTLASITSIVSVYKLIHRGKTNEK